MKSQPHFLPKTKAATLAMSVTIGTLSATAAHADMEERLVVSDSSTVSHTDLTINYAEPTLPTVLAENPGSRIELLDSSVIARLIETSGDIERLSVMAMQAKNGASLNLDGVTINARAQGGTVGSRAIGISVRNEVNRDVNTTSVTANNVNIRVEGSSLQAHDGYGAGVVYPGANLALTGNSVITAIGAYHYGIFAGGGGTVTSTGTTITTDGLRGIGVYANAANQGGAAITLEGGSVTTTGDQAHGLFSMRESGASARNGGHTSSISVTNVTIETSGQGSVGALADRGGNVYLTDSTIITSGENSAGIASAAMTQSPSMAVPSTLTATNTSVSTSGNNASGISAWYGGDVTLTDVTSTSTGNNSHALLATGEVDLDAIAGSVSIDPTIVDGTPSRITGTGVTAIATHTEASAALAERGARIELKDSHLSGSSVGYKNGVVYAREEGTIVLDGGSVTHTTDNTFGNAIHSQDYGSLIQVNNVNVSTNAVGIANHQLASGVYASDGGRVEIANSTIGTVGERAIGLRVAHSNSSIQTENTDITTQGDRAHGVHLFSLPEGTDYNVTAELDGGKVDTSGAGAYALYSQNSGSTITSSADILTTGVNGFGAFALGGGKIILTGGKIITEGGKGATAGTYGLISAGAGSHIEGLGNLEDDDHKSSGIKVTTYGAGATAVRADTRGQITLNDATIATIGSGAHAIESVDAFSHVIINRSSASVATNNSSVAKATNDGSITINHSDLTGSNRGSNNGVVHADTGGSIAVNDSTVYKIGNDYGNTVYAASGGGVYLTRTEVINASDGDSTQSLSAGVYAAAGGHVGLTDSEVSTTGTRAYGIRTAGDGSSINARNSVISTEGNNSHAVQAFVSAAGTQFNNITINGGEIYTEGSESWGLYAQNSGARITSSADIQTTGTSGFGAFALGGGEITLTGGQIVTVGESLDPAAGAGAIGVLSSGAGSRINALGNTDGSKAVSIRTSGAKAHAVEATLGGSVNLRDATLRTEGSEAYGIRAQAGSFAHATNTSITTTGLRSSALRAESNSLITVENSRINSSFYGLQIGNSENSNASIRLTDTYLHSASDAFNVHFGSQNAETVDIWADGNSEILTANNVLLNVNRSADSAGSHSQVVNFTLGTPEGFPASSKTTIARGDILDTSANKGPNDLLNIHVGADAKLYSDNIQGYNNITVHGLIGNNTQNNTALNVGNGQSVSGTGVITKDVVMDGGSLATSVRVRGNLDLGESARETIEVGEGQSITVDAGKQAIITTVANALLDASQGAAVIQEVSGNATVKTGNWGATIAQVSGGVVDASEGTANIASFSNATLHTGSGGATVGSFSGGVISGSTAGESQVAITNLSGGTASTVTLVVNNDGSATEPAGNVNLHSGTIGGNGKVNAALALSGSTFAAGSSVGRLDIADNLSFDAESIYLWEINNATGTAGTYAGGWDYSQIDGLLSFEAGAVFSVNSLGLDNLVGEIANFDELSDYSWLIAVATLGINGWENLLLETDAFLNAYSGSFALSVQPGTGGVSELYLNYTAIPEPATLALLISGAALLATATLRRRKKRIAA